MSEPRTHDFGPGHRCWGHDYTITKVIDGGQLLRVAGWRPPMAVGLLANGTRATRYRIAEYEPVMDPNDMWRATLDFAPRTYATQAEKDATR
jgi:hypothetical protein